MEIACGRVNNEREVRGAFLTNMSLTRGIHWGKAYVKGVCGFTLIGKSNYD